MEVTRDRHDVEQQPVDQYDLPATCPAPPSGTPGVTITAAYQR
jgi:hypothetical protein